MMGHTVYVFVRLVKMRLSQTYESRFRWNPTEMTEQKMKTVARTRACPRLVICSLRKNAYFFLLSRRRSPWTV